MQLGPCTCHSIVLQFDLAQQLTLAMRNSCCINKYTHKEHSYSDLQLRNNPIQSCRAFETCPLRLSEKATELGSYNQMLEGKL